MKQRSILILTNRVPFPLKDGGNLAMHAIIDGYHHAGWKVYLLSMNTSRHPVDKERLAALYPYLDGFDTVHVDNHVKPGAVLANLLFSRQPNHAERFLNKAFSKKLAEILDGFKPEVVQFESVFLTTYLPEIQDKSNAINVLRMHNVEYQVWQRLGNKTEHKIKRAYFKNLAKRIKRFEENAWKQFDLLLPITNEDAEVVRKVHVQTSIVVAPFGIDITNNFTKEEEEKWNGYHIGAMDWLPNAEAIKWFLRDVWPKLHLFVPEFKFYFAGRHMPDAFRKGLPDGVHCMGEVRDAHAFIADKKILIVPLHSGGGIRVKILEAMAAGKVVISTKVGMQGIDAIPGVHFILANEATEFVPAVKWCIEHKQEAEAMAAKAQIFVREEYDQDRITGNVVNRLNDMLKLKHS